MNTSEIFNKISELQYLVGKPTRLHSFWSLFNFSVVVYLSYCAIDFIFFPRQNIPDPLQDVHFGYMLAFITPIFLLTWLATIEVLRVSAPGVFITSFLITIIGILIYGAMQGRVFSIMALIVWAIALLMLGLSFALRIRNVRNGADPEEEAEDFFDSFWSKDMYEYRTLQELRRQNRLKKELIEEFRNNRQVDRW